MAWHTNARNAKQREIDRLKAEGYLTAYDISPHVGLAPATVISRLGEPCKAVMNNTGITRMWSRERSREVFGWPK